VIDKFHFLDESPRLDIQDGVIIFIRYIMTAPSKGVQKESHRGLVQKNFVIFSR
jgi:hypothetical protein